MFELNLNPNEFFVLAHLLRVESYREYKGEVEDGWFAKSQNELVKECGFGCHKRLTRVLEGMVKKSIVQIKPTKTVTYFKIGMGKMTIGQNERMGKITIPTMGKMPEEGMGKIPTLHKNSEKKKEQEYSTSLEMTTSTSTSTNNNKKSKIVENFVDGDNTRFPTIDELRAIFIIENVCFSENDFKGYKSGVLEGKYKLSPKNATMAVLGYLKPAVIKHGYLYDSDNKDIQNAVISYINKKKLNVVIGNNY